MREYTEILHDTVVYPGDTIKYYDEWGNCVGNGVLVKKQNDEVRPLTRSFYILKNIRTGKLWKVNCRRYKFFFKDHKPKNSLDLTDFPEVQKVLKEIQKGTT